MVTPFHSRVMVNIDVEKEAILVDQEKLLKVVAPPKIVRVRWVSVPEAITQRLGFRNITEHHTSLQANTREKERVRVHLLPPVHRAQA